MTAAPTAPGAPLEPAPSAAHLAAAVRADADRWDAWVESIPNAAYPQLSAWAEVKAVNGWRAGRLAVDTAGGVVGCQLLVRPLGPLPWAVGYAPRGPVGVPLADPDAIARWTDAVRVSASRHRLTHVTVDPELESGHGVEAALMVQGWRRAPKVQPDRTRLLDLSLAEDELWSGLRSKWRQYVQKARRAGCVVVEGSEADLDTFYAIYVETARRAGFIHRARSAYADVYRAFARSGRARLLFARAPDGEPVATLMLLRAGPRVIEPYGGMTPRGAQTRANYLLKWEAIRSSRAAGATVYDMWGLAHPGIEQFKEGFGGREVHWTGAWGLVTNRPLHGLVQVAQRGRVLLARRRHGLPDEPGAAGQRATEGMATADGGAG